MCALTYGRDGDGLERFLVQIAKINWRWYDGTLLK